MLAPVAACAAFIAGAFAQSTVTLLPIGFVPDNSLAGEVIGTGTAGTTYELSGVSEGLPFTITLVEGSAVVAETLEIPQASITAAVLCDPNGNLEGGTALCEEQFGNTTETVSLVLAPEAIPISTGSPANSSISSAASSAASSLSSAASSGVSAASSSVSSALSSFSSALSTATTASVSIPTISSSSSPTIASVTLAPASTTTSAAWRVSAPWVAILIALVGSVGALH